MFSIAAFASLVAKGGDDLARLRQYDGGLDEEDLKVQEKLPETSPRTYRSTIEKQVLKKLSEQQEPKEETN